MIINTKIISIQSFVIFYVPVEKIRQIKKELLVYCMLCTNTSKHSKNFMEWKYLELKNKLDK